MASPNTDALSSSYNDAIKEAKVWREPYREYERLANNELRDDLEDNLPEVNDGSLAASLFKLPKRIVPENLSGRVKALDRDDQWLTELANIEWEKKIVPNANMMAPFRRKLKHAVRAAGIYGSVPLITMFDTRGNYTGADFIVAYPYDVTLEPGKVSDSDSDVIWWDLYYTKDQIKGLIKAHKAETKAAKKENREAYHSWNLDALKALLDENKTDRDSNSSPKTLQDKSVTKGGIKLVAQFKRGVGEKFCIYNAQSWEVVREWDNPDPTGDLPVHYLYCYQDFVNPYGIGIIKLAGGTQNVLDYMRQADVLATQIGLEPPIEIAGPTDGVDLDSLVYAKNALWFTGNATLKRQELANGVYSQLPGRMQMYQAALQKMIPTGDTSISGTDSGDSQMSKTPAGVKLAAANLSIDDEDFKTNLYDTYASTAKSMINTHFANMNGTDLLQLTDEEKERLLKAGAPVEMFTLDQETGEASNEVEMLWDNLRAKFDFEVDPASDKVKDDESKLEANMRLLELLSSRPDIEQRIEMSGKRLDLGELFVETINLMSDNDKIITDISPEDQMDVDPLTGEPIDPMQQGMPEEPMLEEGMPQEAPEGLDDDTLETNLQAVMEEHGIDEETAAMMLDYEHQGVDPEAILQALQAMRGQDG